MLNTNENLNETTVTSAIDIAETAELYGVDWCPACGDFTSGTHCSLCENDVVSDAIAVLS